MISLISNIQDIKKKFNTFLYIQNISYFDRFQDIKSKKHVAKLTDILNIQNIPNITYITRKTYMLEIHICPAFKYIPNIPEI